KLCDFKMKTAIGAKTFTFHSPPDIYTARPGSHTIGQLYSRHKRYVGMESIFTENSSVVANEIGARITEPVGFCVTIIVATQSVENPNHRRRELVFTLATWKAPASVTSSLGYQDPCRPIAGKRLGRRTDANPARPTHPQAPPKAPMLRKSTL
ncbi:hypothetical protein FA15DRAFT_676131, partial [Coprinopsis marcescibilis]